MDQFLSKRLREEHAAIAKQAKDFNDQIEARIAEDKAKGEAPRGYTAEEDAIWARMNEDLNDLEKRIARAEATERVLPDAGDPSLRRGTKKSSAGTAGSVPTGQDEALAVAAWARMQAGCEPSEMELEAASRCRINLYSRDCVITRPVGHKSKQYWAGLPIDFGATMSGQDGPIGGYLKEPGSLVRNLELAMLEFGGMRTVAEIITTSDGSPLTWPTGNDTGNRGRRIGESPTLTTTTTANPAFAAHVLNAYPYTSDFILIPFSLLRDSAFDLPSLIGRMLGERVARTLNTDFTTSPGGAAPVGILADTGGAALGVTAASPTAIACDELFDLVHSIDPAYRNSMCGWMFHDNTLLAIRKLKDGIGRYMWQESIQVGEPNRILDYPYTINQDMASSIAASAKVMLFGQLGKYKIRDVGATRLRRADELFMVNDQVGFVYLSSHDGRLVKATGSEPVKYLQMHA